MKRILFVVIMTICCCAFGVSYASVRHTQYITTIDMQGWASNTNVIYFSGQFADGSWPQSYRLDASVFGGVEDARYKMIIALLLLSKQNGTPLEIDVDDATTPLKVVGVKQL